MMKQRNFAPITLLFFLMLFSCIKDVEDTNIPKVQFTRIALDLTLPECTPLQSIGVSVDLESINRYHASEGYNGIMVLQSSPGIYHAFDQCCTNTPEERHQLKPNGALAECPDCGSVFLLLDGIGTRQSGPAPAEYNLRKYNIIRTGNFLFISY